MAGFFKSIVNNTKRALERLASKARAIVDSINSWVKRINRHKVYIEVIEASRPTYAPEKVDAQLAEDLKKTLENIHPDGLIAYMQRMTPEERVQFVENSLLPLITDKMGIKYDRLEWFENDGRLGGYYARSNRTIAINMAYISYDNEKLLSLLINTIIHECKHARQWAAVDGVDLGYSPEQVKEWKRNFEDYISSGESDEGYFKQPLEIDARGFANSVIDISVIFES